MNIMEKGTGIMAGALFAAIALTGCGTEAAKADAMVATGDDGVVESGRYTLDPETPAWKLDTKEDSELTWYVNADWWNTSWGEDVVTRKMKEDLKVNINFLVGDDTKLNTFFAGEDMPDMITIFDASSQVAQKADTWAYSLQELADNYDPYFYKVAAEDTLNWFKLADGNTYGYADYSNTQADYDSDLLPAKTAFAIRDDVYEAIGKPSMESQEDFLAALGMIKEQFPDLVPLGFNNFETDGTSSLGDTLQDYLGVKIVNDDNSHYNRNLDEDYLSWVHTLSEAYRAGYINDDSFTDDNTAWQEKLTIGKYACIMVDGTAQQSGFLTQFTGDTGHAYIAIDGPKSTTGNTPKLNQAGISGWMVTYVSKTCKDPAKAIQLYTYLLDEEGEILTNFGIEGETYVVNEDGTFSLTQEMKDLQAADNDRFKKEIRIGEFIPFGHDKYKALSRDSFPDSIKQMQEWGKGKLYPHFVLENAVPDAGTAEARNYAAIKTFWSTTLVSLIRSGSDEEFDQTLEAYKQFLDENGWEDIEAVMTEKIKANAEKLGN
jgi:putative aldouronate transport system substrate-binding protein